MCYFLKYTFRTIIHRPYFKNIQITYGGVAQLARAPALQAGGQEFDSPHLHQHIEKYIDKDEKVN